jgi:hypothetical protein
MKMIPTMLWNELLIEPIPTNRIIFALHYLASRSFDYLLVFLMKSCGILILKDSFCSTYSSIMSRDHGNVLLSLDSIRSARIC